MRGLLNLFIGLMMIGAVVCFVVAGWLDDRKHELSGVPGGHYAVVEGDRSFYVPRGGPPVEERPHVALTAELYCQWDGNEKAASRWAGRGGLCFLLAIGAVVVARMAGSKRQTATESDHRNAPS
jgi:hypothetical protein